MMGGRRNVHAYNQDEIDRYVQITLIGIANDSMTTIETTQSQSYLTRC